MRRTPILTAIAIITLAQITRAQQSPNGLDAANAERDALVQQMQGLQQQVVDNMRTQGIDPNEFAQQLTERIRNGSGDPAQVMQEMLVEQGLISDDVFKQALTTMNRIGLLGIRRQLASSDEEWGVVEKKLQRVVAAIADADPETFSRLSSGTFGANLSNSPMQKARRDLREAVANPNVSPERLTMVLTDWRREHTKAKAELAAARNDLTNILTLRQEAILLNMGVL